MASLRQLSGMRRMRIRVEIDLWSWPAGSKREVMDISTSVLNYRFQKSIKNPQGSCQIAMLPQMTDTHILDVINPMDVIKIYEFGTLKFIGYVVRISYGGSIGEDGKPQRNATITCQQMGGLFVTASVGLGLGTALGVEGGPLIAAATDLEVKLMEAVDDGVSFAEMLSVLTGAFTDYLKAIGATNLTDYLSTYVDTETGLSSKQTPALPRSFELFTGTEQSISFWNVADTLVERPFNELWIDNGPRTVSIDGKNVTLGERSSFVFRPTPFNGTKRGGAEGSAFDSLPTVEVGKDHLLKFNLSRSMDEVYTFYSVKEPAFKLDDIVRILLGQAVIDKDRIGKYLMKPLITELFYTRMTDSKGEAAEATGNDLETASKEASETLRNWYSKNDEYLSGVITSMVPEESEDDPKIGQKLSVYGIDGLFYVEGIAHVWNYQGPLKTDLTVTRGHNAGSKIEMKDKIFRRNRIK